MQTYDQFFNQWNNKPCEVSDPTNKEQCMDLAFAWCDAREIPRIAIAHLYAYQVYSVPTEDTYLHFYRIPNTPRMIPKVGDLIVWTYAFNNSAGHIGVVHHTPAPNLNKVTVFQQNDPIYSDCHLKEYNYTNVAGFLRPMNLSIVTNDCQQYIEQINQLQGKINCVKNCVA